MNPASPKGALFVAGGIVPRRWAGDEFDRDECDDADVNPRSWGWNRRER